MPYWIPAGLLIGLVYGLATTGVMIRIPYLHETLECRPIRRLEKGNRLPCSYLD